MDMENGVSMILELLEYEHSFENKGHSAAQEQDLVIRRIFDDITSASSAQAHVVDKVLVSEDMGSTTASIPIVRKLQEYPQAVLTARHAVQPRVRPIHETAVEVDGVYIISMNVRLQPVDTDLVLSVYMTRFRGVTTTDPDGIVNQMDSLELDQVLGEGAIPDSLPSVVQHGIRVFRRVCETLDVLDWSLFTP